ncbi:hypothetical protein PSTG_11639 [Puccinia striiformis f. sp. tritici PST-78]|uniref:DDE Tnp4 domain-containing protein n=1 Tax=Puccinia striiformis f. sp. tritici PST-78 TaxID=1165861 RepID=A0A0L0V794_9BASI|nr:hypothetical protein PSTG_11639 [Puccinia striiformis f. sp. tritici PST-78]
MQVTLHTRLPPAKTETYIESPVSEENLAYLRLARIVLRYSRIQDLQQADATPIHRHKLLHRYTMPRQTERGSAITRMTRIIHQHVQGAMIELALNDKSAESSEDSDLEDALVSLIMLKKNRYLAPRVRLGRAPEITKYLFSLDDIRFKQEFRMCQESFHQLVSEIRDHPVFQNRSNIPQRPVQDQLMVTLKRMGTYGNGASVGMLARFFRISEGTVILYCSRTIETILALEERYVSWPDTQGHRAIASRVDEFTGFRNCVGFIDGTLLPLYDRPSIDPQDYYSRKGFYCLNTLIVCDEEKRITYYLTGWPGCCHDTRLWENLELKLKERELFTPGEYLIADSGFPVQTNVVPAFKRPPHAAMPRLMKRFNHHLSSIRVRNEHCIGILKGRFQSLRGLRKDLSSAGTMEKITHWILACIVLHNFLLEDKTPDYYEGDVDTEGSNSNGARQSGDGHGNELRDQVFAEVIDFLDS